MPAVGDLLKAFLLLWQREVCQQRPHHEGRHIRNLISDEPDALLLLGELGNGRVFQGLIHLHHGGMHHRGLGFGVLHVGDVVRRGLLRRLFHLHVAILLLAIRFRGFILFSCGLLAVRSSSTVLGLDVCFCIGAVLGFGLCPSLGLLRFRLGQQLSSFGLCLALCHISRVVVPSKERLVQADLLLFQEDLTDVFSVVGRGLSNQHLGRVPQPGGGEELKERGPILLCEVGLDLHDHDVAALNSSSRQQRLLHSAIIQGIDTKVGFRLVVRSPRRLPPVALDATLQAPIHHLPITDLGELGMLGEKPIHPMESALSGQKHREEHLWASVFLRWVLDVCHICLCGIVHHAALEWHVCQGLGAEVHMHRQVLEGNHGEQRLALQNIRDRLRPGNPLAVPEERHRECVGAFLRQIKHNGQR
mmetsp:Transcript_68886/g.161432  ORF Transcript_68886/g.161432 Transcript_68886/m.161432 type:complete len:417 (+) Transcript_68886:1235-2485(+)